MSLSFESVKYFENELFTTKFSFDGRNYFEECLMRLVRTYTTTKLMLELTIVLDARFEMVQKTLNASQTK